MKNKKKQYLFTAIGMVMAFFCCGCVQKESREPEPVQWESVQQESLQKNSAETEMALEQVPETVIAIDSDDSSGAAHYLEMMTLEEKVAQLFVVVPEALVNAAGEHAVDQVTAAGERTKEALQEYPVGGLIYMGNNLISAEQTTSMLRDVQEFSMDISGLPLFLCVDEEGGTVARISGKEGFDIPAIVDMAEIGKMQDAGTAKGNLGETVGETAGETVGETAYKTAYETGVQIGAYLSALGFNLDFAPVADVWSNPENTVVKRRSFGSDAAIVSNLALALSDGLTSQGVCSTFKHFPGHGATAGDTHEGYAYTSKTLEELRACELVPFQAAVDAGADFFLAGHISLPEFLGVSTPASLSSEMLTGVLREEMGYDGIIVTDALNMGAVVQHYTSAEAAVKALQAGADLLLMPENFEEAYQGVLAAAEDGRISQERIDASVRKILEVKLRMRLE